DGDESPLERRHRWPPRRWASASLITTARRPTMITARNGLRSGNRATSVHPLVPVGRETHGPVGLAAADRQQVVQGAAGGGVEGLREARAAVLGHEALRVLGEAPRGPGDAAGLTFERDGARPC